MKAHSKTISKEECTQCNKFRYHKALQIENFTLDLKTIGIVYVSLEKNPKPISGQTNKAV